MRKQLLISGPCCGLALAPSPAVLAKTSEQSIDHPRIEAMEARVAALEQRLDMRQATAQPASHHRTSVTPAPTSAARTAPAAAAAPASADWSGLHRGMDGSAGGHRTDRPAGSQAGPSDVGNLVLPERSPDRVGSQRPAGELEQALRPARFSRPLRRHAVPARWPGGEAIAFGFKGRDTDQRLIEAGEDFPDVLFDLAMGAFSAAGFMDQHAIPWPLRGQPRNDVSEVPVRSIE